MGDFYSSRVKKYIQNAAIAIDNRKYLNSFPLSVIRYPLSVIRYPKILSKIKGVQLSTTLIFLLFSIILFTKVQAQVIIKEKVEINPQKTILTKTPAGNHTIRVDIQWSPSSLPGWILFYDLQCDQQDYYSPSTTTGTNSFSLTSQGYENYPIQFRFGSLDPNQPIVSGSYQIYYDEIFIRSATFTANKASYTNFAYYNTYYQSPVLTDYTFLISGNEICFGLYKNVQIETSRNCNTTAEINTEQDSITLTIETGKEFVSFYKNNQKKDTVTFMYHELGSVYLRQDSIYTDTASINVNIKSDWTGIIKYQQLVINPQEQFQIRVPDQPIIVFSGGVGGLKIEPYSSSICPPYISENLRYTALIKKGSSRGLLYDYDTGIGGDTLTNLTPQEDGEKYLDFITEGEIINEQDTVLIKIFANDENIDTTEAVIIIYPNDLVVQIIPSVISQGDTARVVLKKRGVNGLEDFAADKLFNVEIVQGIDYGLILDSLSNDTLTSFSDIPQGFKIIAKDSTGIDSTKIRIKVTTEESFFPLAKMLTVDKYKLYIKESDKKAKEEAEDEKDKTIIPNFIIPGTLLLEGYGDVLVKKDGDWCDSLIVCNTSEYLPNVILNQVPNGYNGRDICNDKKRPLEGVNAYWTDTLYTIEVSLCKNEQRQKLWFSINDNHSLKVNYSYAVCEDNFPLGCQFIDDWRGISDTLDCDQFEAVLHATYFYGGHANKPCYFFRNIIYAHEMEHIIDYQSAIDVAMISFYEDLNSISVICSDFENMNSAKIYMQNLLDDRFNKFKRRGLEEFINIQITGALRSKREIFIDSYEQDVQNRKSVRAVINSQIDEVNSSYGCSIIHLYE